MLEQLPKGDGQIGQVTLHVKRFEQAHASANLQSFRPGEFACIEIIEQHYIRLNFLCQENGAQFSIAQRILFPSCQQALLILKFFHFDPFRFRNLKCSGQANTGDDYLVVNFCGNIEFCEEPIEEIEAANLCKDDQRR